MFLPNPHAGLFDHQYLWNESTIALDFLQWGCYQRKIASKSAILVTCVLVCPATPRPAAVMSHWELKIS